MITINVYIGRWGGGGGEVTLTFTYYMDLRYILGSTF